MNARIAPLMVIALAVAGCSQSHSYWYQRGKTLEQAQADCRDCRRQAQQEAGEAAAHEYISHLDSSLHRRGDFGAFHESLESDDSTFIDASPAPGGPYEQNVFDGCMKRKGYQQLKSHRLPPDARTKSLSLGAVAGR